jgi:YVTN family beta-propeller protein
LWAARIRTLALAGILASAQTFAQNAYITNNLSNTVSVIDTVGNNVIATIPVGASPWGVAVSPDGSRVYVTNQASRTVSVVDTATNTVTATIPVGDVSIGLAVTPNGSKVYVANDISNTVSVIDTVTNAVAATVSVGSGPIAFGVFIQPAPRFAGTPGRANCHGQSVAALARQFQGLFRAAAALGFSSVTALQNTILAYCGG